MPGFSIHTWQIYCKVFKKIPFDFFSCGLNVNFFFYFTLQELITVKRGTRYIYFYPFIWTAWVEKTSFFFLTLCVCVSFYLLRFYFTSNKMSKNWGSFHIEILSEKKKQSVLHVKVYDIYFCYYFSAMSLTVILVFANVKFTVFTFYHTNVQRILFCFAISWTTCHITQFIVIVSSYRSS